MTIAFKTRLGFPAVVVSTLLLLMVLRLLCSVCLVEHNRGTFCMHAKAGVGEDLFPPCASLVQQQPTQNDPVAAHDTDGIAGEGKSPCSTSSSKSGGQTDLTKACLKSNFTLFPR